MDISQLTQDDLRQADDVILRIHKQAYFGRLHQLGFAPQGQTQQVVEKEAQALLELGFDLAEMQLMPGTKAASAGTMLGNGPFALAKQALDQHRNVQAPGFEGLGKTAAAPGFENLQQHGTALPPALIDAAHKTAAELARYPDVYRAALVKRAALEAMAAAKAA